ncbi:MAG: hypothetical protein MI923_03915, partial [Phycisphaerales bacterium]|nr:hypothetical protein [Phycisphaerales bacterium]
MVIAVVLITSYQGLTDRYYINNDARGYYLVHTFPENLEDNVIAQHYLTKFGMRMPVVNFYAFVDTF